MGSVFSGLQFIVSPQIGALSDRYGRKNVLLISMLGNILSAVVSVCWYQSWIPILRISFRWIQSTTFASYMLSRVIGGLSEGNVQLAMFVS